jgi:mRNA interferase MazF
MTLQRGDVVLARVPHTAGTRGKKRPAVVIQGDRYNAKLRHAVVAEVTSGQQWAGDPACLFVDVATPEGLATGLHKSGFVSCLHLVTMNTDRLGVPIGRLAPVLVQRLNDCLKAALELP